ncbi:MAG: hypothetical protein OXU81_23805 [Gammaproteobacteria bacterium]|nr:hypothetical protein [Gammaproteobacteria bacterium]
MHRIEGMERRGIPSVARPGQGPNRRRSLICGVLVLVAAAHIATPSSAQATTGAQPGIVLSMPALTIDEGGAAGYTVALRTRPAGKVRITVWRSSYDIVFRRTTVPLIFTTDNWNVPQTVTLRAPHDDDARDGAVVLTHAASGGGYGRVPPVRLEVTVADDDEVGIVLSKSALTIDEGGDAGYTVALRTRPAGKVRITVWRSSYDIVFRRTTVPLIFTTDNWNVPQTVTLRAPHDDDARDGAVVLTHAASGGGYGRVPPVTLRVTVDRSGNDAESFTTGQGDVPAVTNISKQIDPMRFTTAVSLARAYILEIDASGTGEDERITTVEFEVTNEGNLPDTPLWTVTFGGDATYGSDYRVSPADSDPTTDGHQVQGSRTEKAIEITITARADSTPNEAEQIQMSAEVEVGGHEHRFASKRLRIFEAIDAVAIRVASARAEEGVDETIDFRVYLDRPAFTTLTVDYATSDGTAVAGQDYTVKSGRLTFEEGDAEQTIPVRILDDAVDEGEETFTLTLSNAVGARIADATAIGTIANDDPLQKAWLARFGRTVGSQAVDAVTGRLDGAPASEVSIGGRSLSGGGDTSTLAEAEAHACARAMKTWLCGEEEAMEDPKALSARDVLLGSHFNLSAGGETGTPRYNAWGRLATGAFEGEDGDATLSGDVTSGFFGADIEAGRWLGGVAVGLSEGEGPFELTGSATPTRRGGTVDNSLIAAYPYLRLRATERLSLWGMGGFGFGTMTVTQEDDPGIEADISMRMGALGVKGTVLDAPPEGGLALNVRSDVMHVRMESDAVTSRAGNMEGAETDVTRYRLILEGARAFPLAGDATLTPALEMGLRHDAGDAETGTGLEVAARIAYARPGMTIEGAARTLVAHEDSGYEEWGRALRCASTRASQDAGTR